MITAEDAYNIIILLDRVEYKGLREAELVIRLVQKLQKIKDDAT
jgi:hypothetical protein